MIGFLRWGRLALTAVCVMTAGVAEAAPRGFDRVWETVVSDYKAGLAAEGIIGSSLAVAQGGKLLGTAHLMSMNTLTETRGPLFNKMRVDMATKVVAALAKGKRTARR